jgi:predicted nucleotidyltransferase
MLHELSLDNDLRNEINKLLEKKKSAGELGRGPRINVLSEFLENELQIRIDQPVNLPRIETDLNQLNRLLSEILNEVWLESSETA